MSKIRVIEARVIEFRVYMHYCFVVLGTIFAFKYLKSLLRTCCTILNKRNPSDFPNRQIFIDVCNRFN